MRQVIAMRVSSWLGVDVPVWLVPTQMLLVGFGFLAASVGGVWLARRAGLPLRRTALGLAGSFIGALVGSRLLGAVLRVDLWTTNPLALLYPRQSGSVSFGALLGGALALWYLARRWEMNPWRFADAMAPAAGLGLFFARLGCFVHGCDFGRVTSLSWGVRYPSGTLAFKVHVEAGLLGPYQLESLAVHPFQLALAFFDLGIFVVFALAPRWGSARAGDRAFLVGAVYFAGRFALEFMRSPHSAPVLGALNSAQWFCVVGLLFLYVAKRRQDAKAIG